MERFAYGSVWRISFVTEYFANLGVYRNDVTGLANIVDLVPPYVACHATFSHVTSHAPKYCPVDISAQACAARSALHTVRSVRQGKSRKRCKCFYLVDIISTLLFWTTNSGLESHTILIILVMRKASHTKQWLKLATYRLSVLPVGQAARASEDMPFSTRS